MAGVIHPRDRIMFVGDSLTALGWFSDPGCFVPQLNIIMGSSVVGARRLLINGSPAKAGAGAAFFDGAAVSALNRGAVGWTSVELLADAPTAVTSTPDVIVCCIGINDAVNGTPIPADFRDNLDDTLDIYQAALPSVRIFIVSPFLWKEQWTSVGPALDNAHDAAIDAIVTECQGSALSHGATFCPTRPQALLYEIAHNTPEPGAEFGILMDNTFIHPTLLGQQKMSDYALEQVVVTP